MSEELQTAIMAAAVSIVTGLITALVTLRNARLKLKEQRNIYEQQLTEVYLKNARDYMGSVYLPLSIALSKLNSAYLNSLAGDMDNTSFQIHIEDFLDSYQELTNKGAGAFLTTDLDEILQKFSGFLRSSMETTETKVVYAFSFGVLGLRTNQKFPVKVKNMRFYNWMPKNLHVDSYLSEFGFRVEEAVSAPLMSDDFNRRFSRDIHQINILVKEVTLGAKARA